MTLTEIKALLTHFAASRAGHSPQDAEAEYGDLLLCMIQLAEKAGIDLLASATSALERQTRNKPRPVTGNNS